MVPKLLSTSPSLPTPIRTKKLLTLELTTDQPLKSPLNKKMKTLAEDIISSMKTLNTKNSKASLILPRITRELNILTNITGREFMKLPNSFKILLMLKRIVLKLSNRNKALPWFSINNNNKLLSIPAIFPRLPLTYLMILTADHTLKPTILSLAHTLPAPIIFPTANIIEIIIKSKTISQIHTTKINYQNKNNKILNILFL